MAPSPAQNSPIIGIDLGTTNSVVAAVVAGRVQVLEEDGEPLLPSVVGLDADGKLITGVAARNQHVAFPERTIASVKRSMGSMDRLRLGDDQYTPPEISAMILRRLRDRASQALGCDVTRAVITVPAFFDENQRQATREAGELAGLTVERIINEPTAATLVYHAGSQDRMHLVVYDFGGGTFDVSIVRMEAGVVEVLSSKGDTKLGGDDLDMALMNHVADMFYNDHELDLRKSASTRWRLLQACEAAKRQLSTDHHCRISEEFIAEKDGQPLHLDVTLTREQFQELIAGMVERTIDCVDEAIQDAKLKLTQIDELVLVGGSTRIPLVAQRLREELHLEPSRAVDPDLAVALGAATQAAMLDGQTVGPVLVDVTTHTLGIEVLDQTSMFGGRLLFSPIIHRGTPLPAQHEEGYHATHDDQDRADIHVLQGEHQQSHQNESIGRFNLPLTQTTAGRPRITVRFELSLDGMLRVVATQDETGQSEELTILNALTQFREDEREHAAFRLEELFTSSDEINLPPSPAPAADAPDADANDTQQTVHSAESISGPKTSTADANLSPAEAMLAKAKRVGSQVSGDDAEEIRSLVDDLEAAMAAEDAGKVESICRELDDVLFYVEI